LKDTWYKANNEINTKYKTDLVIHTGKTSKDAVGVILEVKRPSNKGEMISASKPNTKALHEMMLYYLRETVDNANTDIKYLIVTNIYEWFIFDEAWFLKNVYRNTKLRKDYDSWKLANKDTRFFYENIAKPFLDGLDEKVDCTHFDLREFTKIITNNDKADDKKLIALYKILSPVHLLKQRFANDSNSLDTKFYSELLYIIGLEEVKDGGKKLIRRKAKPDHASLLENTLLKIKDRESLRNIQALTVYGSTTEEQSYHVALELCITWINRILFLKLLEAQLFKYHKGDKAYLFLNTATIFDYDELSNLFFQVLAEKTANRRDDLQAKFSHVPYLNSSLFDRTQLERQTIDIGALDNRMPLPLQANTVLKDAHGKRRTGTLTTLQYLFEFLEAYDFTSEGAEEIQEDNKNLINASVLGLIFEKINGYKDGSFFTPGFVTMYMCRETIRRAVYQKFNDAKGWNVETMEQLYDKISDKKEANTIINSLTICDPAVGSGHFLVSALNEVIAIKSELKILLDRQGKTLRDYEVEVVNDELIITDDNGLLDYNPNHKESQRVQETLFHEKQTIIENCLFGVDINPNSVKICRLRLWIELLKSTYYHTEPVAPSKQRELETLPNIDINIKCGNSLISRFALDADIKAALRKSKWNIESYKLAVQTYREAESKEEKRDMESLIETIKKDFRSEISVNDKKIKALSKVRGELFNLSQTKELFDEGNKKNKDTKKKIEDLSKEITKLETEIEEIKNNKIYDNAFEWRFEFPEVLSGEGDFVGFDVVIGNPPYIRQEEIGDLKSNLKTTYEVFSGTADLLVYFFELAIKLIKPHASFCMITSNKFIKANYGKPLRKFLLKYQITDVVDFGELKVFEEAATFPVIFSVKKISKSNFVKFTQIQSLDFGVLKKVIDKTHIILTDEAFDEDSWNLTNSVVNGLLSKIRKKGVPLNIELEDKYIYRGLLTGFNEAFVIDEITKDELIRTDPKSEEIIYPFSIGDDIRNYNIRNQKRYIIITKIGIDIEKFKSVYNHLKQYKNQLEKRTDKGNHWWELRSCGYYEMFTQPKIVYPDIAKESRFAYSSEIRYFSNTCYFFPSNNLALLGILNSKVLWFWFKNALSVLGDSNKGGRLRFFSQDFMKTPIPKVNQQTRNTLHNIVSEIINLRKEGRESEIAKLETTINKVVYELFEFTKTEIEIIEG